MMAIVQLSTEFAHWQTNKSSKCERKYQHEIYFMDTINNVKLPKIIIFKLFTIISIIQLFSLKMLRYDMMNLHFKKADDEQVKGDWAIICGTWKT